MVRAVPMMLALLVISAIGLLTPEDALAENTVKVVYQEEDESLSVKEAAIGGNCASLATTRPIVAVYVFYENPIGNQLKEEWSGHELFSCFDDNGKIVVQQLDVSGGDKGARRKGYQPNGPADAIRDLPDNIAETAAAGEVNWDVVNGGTGGPYNSLLADARTLVGFP